jgi:type IV fimbrial biogenesis protein FimT
MGKMHQEGVTLIELLVTLSVVAIIVAVGVPALRDFFATNQMSAAANDLVTSMHLARSEAIKREVSTRMCPSDNWDAPDPTCTALGSLADGWIVIADPAGDADVVQAHEPLPDNIRLDYDFIDSIDFTSSGLPGNANVDGELNLLICDDRGDHDTVGGIAAGRWINIRGPGRPRIYTKQADVQAMLGGC